MIATLHHQKGKAEQASNVPVAHSLALEEQNLTGKCELDRLQVEAQTYWEKIEALKASLR
jgi:hypothetical protein